MSPRSLTKSVTGMRVILHCIANHCILIDTEKPSSVIFNNISHNATDTAWQGHVSRSLWHVSRFLKRYISLMRGGDICIPVRLIRIYFHSKSFLSNTFTTRHFENLPSPKYHCCPKIVRIREIKHLIWILERTSLSSMCILLCLCLLVSDWSRQITWPLYWALICCRITWILYWIWWGH